MVFQLDQRCHEAGGQVKVGHIRHQAGVVLAHMGWGLSLPHMGGLAVKAMGRRTKVLGLVTPPGGMIPSHAWRGDPLVGVMMGWGAHVWGGVTRWNIMIAYPMMVVRYFSCPTSGEVSLGVVKAVRGVRRPLKVVSGGKVVLHEARREAAKVVRRRRRLVEGWGLLVRREGSSEVRGPLHAWRERLLSLAPRRLVRLVPPRRLLVVLGVPGPLV